MRLMGAPTIDDIKPYAPASAHSLLIVVVTWSLLAISVITLHRSQRTSSQLGPTFRFQSFESAFTRINDCCYISFCWPRFVTGMAASSLRKHRYSPTTVVTTSAAAFMTHHIQLVGIRPLYKDCCRVSDFDREETHGEKRMKEQNRRAEVQTPLCSFNRIKQ